MFRHYRDDEDSYYRNKHGRHRQFHEDCIIMRKRKKAVCMWWASVQTLAIILFCLHFYDQRTVMIFYLQLVCRRQTKDLEGTLKHFGNFLTGVFDSIVFFRTSFGCSHSSLWIQMKIHAVLSCRLLLYCSCVKGRIQKNMQQSKIRAQKLCKSRWPPWAPRP